VGALIQDMNEDLAESFGYDSPDGVLIGDVVADGPAEKAGLQSGDIVVKFNGKRVATANEFRNSVAATNPGREAEVEVFRDGKRKTLAVEIGQLEQSKLTLGRGSEAAVDLGMTVETLTTDTARELGYDSDERGVVVTEVEQGSLAARVGIRPKDIIVSVSGEEIKDVADFRKAMRDRDPDKGFRMQVKRDGVRRFIFIKSGR
jgi:serine protease Do